VKGIVNLYFIYNQALHKIKNFIVLFFHTYSDAAIILMHRELQSRT